MTGNAARGLRLVAAAIPLMLSGCGMFGSSSDGGTSDRRLLRLVLIVGNAGYAAVGPLSPKIAGRYASFITAA
jgi:hypothetical protein